MKRTLPTLALGSLLVACTVLPPATTPVASVQGAATPAEQPQVAAAAPTAPPATPSAIAPTPEVSAAPSASPSPARRKKRRSTVPSPFVYAELGVSLTNYVYTPTGTTDGVVTGEATMMVQLPGQAAQQIRFQETDAPVDNLDEVDDTLTVIDPATGNTRIYTADQEFFTYSVDDPTLVNYRVQQFGGGSERDDRLRVETFPVEGEPGVVTYTVDGEECEDVAAAAAACLEDERIAGASLPGLVALYAITKHRTVTSSSWGAAEAYSVLGGPAMSGTRGGTVGPRRFRLLSGELVSPATALLQEIIRQRLATDATDGETEAGGEQ